MLSAVMVVEGLLRIPGSEGHIDTGWHLYQALAKNTRLYLLSHQWTEEQSALWLAKRRLTAHLAYLHAADPGPEGRVDALERIRSWHVSLVLESDPACGAAEIAAGWDVGLISHALPADRMRRGAGIHAWDDLTEAIERRENIRLAKETP